MIKYSKSLQDYFRILIWLRPVGNSRKAVQQLSKILTQCCLQIDKKYLFDNSNVNTKILSARQPCTHKLFFRTTDFHNDWPQFQVMYKCRFAMGVIQKGALISDEAVKDQIIKLKKTLKQQSVKLVGIIVFHETLKLDLFKDENCMIIPQKMCVDDILIFIEPWLYTCLESIESEICNWIAQCQQQNSIIVFNKNQERTDQKLIKRKKKARCLKLCGDYSLMLHMYKQAQSYFKIAEEQLFKLQDYIWLMGCMQGRLASLTACFATFNINAYVQQLITISKKTKSIIFQKQNYIKILKLLSNDGTKVDELAFNYYNGYLKNTDFEEKTSFYILLSEMYSKCSLHRKANYYLYLAIHKQQNTQAFNIILKKLSDSSIVKEWPQMHSNLLQCLLNANQYEDGKIILQLLVNIKTVNKKLLMQTLSTRMFKNVFLNVFSFLKIRNFRCIHAISKPKLNKISSANRGLFKSWEKEDFMLFEEQQLVEFKCDLELAAQLPLPLHLQMNIMTQEEKHFYSTVISTNFLQFKIKLKGKLETIHTITQIQLLVWNFSTIVKLDNPIKYQLYQKLTDIHLDIPQEIQIEESSKLLLSLKMNNFRPQIHYKFCKLSIAVYYNINIGYQQNQYSWTDQIDALNIQQGQLESSLSIHNKVANLILCKFKTHRRHISKLQFILQYMNDKSSKYKRHLHYVLKTNLKKSLICEFISATDINPTLFPNTISIAKVFLLTIRLYKLKDDLTPYQINFNNRSYHLSSSSEMDISVQWQKQQQTDEKQIQLFLPWSNMLEKDKKGTLEINVPFSKTIKKSKKIITFSKSKQNNKVQVIKYRVEGDTNLSHSFKIITNKIYAFRGKTKLIGKQILENNVKIQFINQQKKDYCVCLLFNDGQLYTETMKII